MSKTPEELSAEAAQRVKLAGENAQKQVEVGAVKAAAAVASSAPNPLGAVAANIANMTQEQLEEAINKVLGAKKQEKKEEATPASPANAEPDWANLSETQALDLRVSNIPIYEHEVPSYMDIKLEDPNYIAVWANRDQRRIGHLLAEGYEFLRKEHISKEFSTPLKFDSEGMYIYVDVVAMRVHKRIAFGKRRKYVEQSFYQLKRQEEVAKSKLTKVISNDPHLEDAFESGSMEFYTS